MILLEYYSICKQLYKQDNLSIFLSLSFSDDKAESRSTFGPSAAGGRFCGYVVEERHEPGDGRAGERALGVATHPNYPWPLSLGEHPLYQKSLWNGLTFRFSHLCWSVFHWKLWKLWKLWLYNIPVMNDTPGAQRFVVSSEPCQPPRPGPSWFCQRHCIQTLLNKQFSTASPSVRKK